MNIHTPLPLPLSSPTFVVKIITARFGVLNGDRKIPRPQRGAGHGVEHAEGEGVLLLLHVQHRAPHHTMAGPTTSYPSPITSYQVTFTLRKFGPSRNPRLKQDHFLTMALPTAWTTAVAISQPAWNSNETPKRGRF